MFGLSQRKIRIQDLEDELKEQKGLVNKIADKVDYLQSFKFIYGRDVEVKQEGRFSSPYSNSFRLEYKGIAIVKIVNQHYSINDIGQQSFSELYYNITGETLGKLFGNISNYNKFKDLIHKYKELIIEDTDLLDYNAEDENNG